jgi:hypothetical protein
MTGATIKDSAVAKLTNIPKLPEYSYLQIITKVPDKRRRRMML